MHTLEKDTERAWQIFLRYLLQLPELQGCVLQICCRLLCCSQAMVKLVHSSCNGSLHACVGQQPPEVPNRNSACYQSWRHHARLHAAALGRWLHKHAVLLCTLELSMWPEQEEAVAAGLQAAAVADSCHMSSSHPQVPHLPLRSFRCTTASNGRILCALAAVQLTALDLHLQLQQEGLPAQQCRAALCSLTDLKCLTLRGSWCSTEPLGVLGPSLQHLSQLSQLQLPRVLVDAATVQQLPASLLQLKVCCHNQPLHLQRFSALRCLHLEQELHAGEVLPPSLTALQLGCCKSVMPLVALPRLQWLRVDADLTAEQLQQLSVMTQLVELQLTYFCQQGRACQDSALPAAAELFSRVPLKALKLLGQWGGARLPAAVVAQLGLCSQLTSLSLLDMTLDATPQQLGAQLSHLQGLKQLKLQALQWQQAAEGSQEPCSSSLQLLVQAVMGLSGLRELSWSGLATGPEAATLRASLQAATHLTALDLEESAGKELAAAMQQCCVSRC